MNYNIRGDKLVVTDSIKEYIETKFGRLDKYFREPNLFANILVKVRGKNQIIEVTIHTDKFILRSEEEHDDLYAAIDLVTDKLERQIRKNKTKLKKQNINNKFKDFNLDYDIKEEEENNNKIVKRKVISMKPMDEEEAILEMELLSHEFFVYKDSDLNEICILYRRKDGNYGLIETK